jgi:hypothetical protein
MGEPLHAQAARPLSNAHLQNARSVDMNSRCHNVDLYEGTAMVGASPTQSRFLIKSLPKSKVF